MICKKQIFICLLFCLSIPYFAPIWTVWACLSFTRLDMVIGVTGLFFCKKMHVIKKILNKKQLEKICFFTQIGHFAFSLRGIIYYLPYKSIPTNFAPMDSSLFWSEPTLWTCLSLPSLIRSRCNLFLAYKICYILLFLIKAVEKISAYFWLTQYF